MLLQGCRWKLNFLLLQVFQLKLLILHSQAWFFAFSLYQFFITFVDYSGQTQFSSLNLLIGVSESHILLLILVLSKIRDSPFYLGFVWWEFQNPIYSSFLYSWDNSVMRKRNWNYLWALRQPIKIYFDLVKTK